MKKKLTAFILFLLAAIVLTGGITAYLDPFMLYHEPVDDFYYELDNARYQNNGIIKFYDYDAIISGTSITQNFSTNQMDELFQVTSIRVPLPGGTCYEIGQQIDLAFESGHDLTLTLISLDLNHLIEDKDAQRTDLGVAPEYLFNANPFDDVEYLFNRDVMLDYCVPMIVKWLNGEDGGATQMEDYYRLAADTGGAELFLTDRTQFTIPDISSLEGLTEEERTQTTENIEQNILQLAKAHPDTQFIYFTAPYNVAWWGNLYETGMILKYLDAEQLAYELMLEVDNIQIYCYANEWDMATNLDLYADYIHYIKDVNDLLLADIGSGYSDALLSADNYLQVMEEQREYLLNYDYNSLFGL